METMYPHRNFRLRDTQHSVYVGTADENLPSPEPATMRVIGVTPSTLSRDPWSCHATYDGGTWKFQLRLSKSAANEVAYLSQDDHSITVHADVGPAGSVLTRYDFHVTMRL